MLNWVLVFGWGGCGLVAAGAAGFIVTSIHERRWRAAGVAALVFLPILVLLGLTLAIDYPGRQSLVTVLLILAAAGVVPVTLPMGRNPKMRIVGQQEQWDEREAIFHRFYRLKPGLPEFDEYYRQHPEKHGIDAKLRKLPGLAQPGSRAYDPATSPFAMATFDIIERMNRELDWTPNPSDDGPVQTPPEELTQRVKGFARYAGANLVGVAKLNRAYVYSHIGRSPGTWGEAITLDHEWAIAIACEMKHEMIRHAPHAATMTETAAQYLETAKVAMLVARYINALGYEARAHVDGNYRVLCTPIAADAGLGEVGRIGLLMTPQYGPRVRLSIVTTNMPMTPDKPVHFGVQDFCEICRKCARNCPSNSITSGAKGIYKGVEKWQNNQEKCYGYWCMQGTDCAICINVCPFSHPATPLHNLVRWAVRRNRLARRLALWGDDLFYGRRPKGRYPLPAWHAKSRPSDG